MDISRSIFSLEHPRSRLDAGTNATMGVGLGYAVAAHAAYNNPQPEGLSGSRNRKKVVAIEGDSAFGFSGMEVETMSRFGMDVLVFVMNNSGLYRGDSDSAEKWKERQTVTISGDTATGETATTGATPRGKGLSAMSLGYETNYEKIAEMCGGIGIVARTPEELKQATSKGYEAKVPVIVNVIIDTTSDLEIVSTLSHLASTSNCKARLLTFGRTSHGSIWLRPPRKSRSSNTYMQHPTIQISYVSCC